MKLEGEKVANEIIRRTQQQEDVEEKSIDWVICRL